MTRLLGLIAVLLLAVSGCGAERDAAQDPGEASSGPGAAPTQEFGYDVVALVSGSAAHGPGVRGTRPTLIADEDALAVFAEQFQGPLPSALRTQGGQALKGLGPKEALTATVVAVGCDPPTKVTVEREGGSTHVAAVPVKSTIQCLVPVTTVALVSMPEEFAPGFAQPLGAE
jgi:hypothetical protein